MAKSFAPFVRSPYNYDTALASHESGLSCPEPSLAVQSELDDTDINVIVERFGLLGELPTGVRAPNYGDFTGVSDFQSAQNAIIAAEASFMELPAKVRARFNHDPGAFVDFCSDEANRKEAEALGLVVPPAPSNGPSDRDAPTADATLKGDS